MPSRRHGVDIFTRSVYADLVIESHHFCTREKGLCVHAWVLIPNHLHAIHSAKDGFLLSDILRDFKRFKAGKILKELQKSTSKSRKSWMLWHFISADSQNSRNETYQFWKEDNHPIELNNPTIKLQRMNYLHQNPVRAGLVWEPWEYRYSSACDDMNNKMDGLKLILFSFGFNCFESRDGGNIGTAGQAVGMGVPYTY